VFEGRPHIVDAIKNGEVQLIFNTTEGARSLSDSYTIRRTALEMRVPCYTTASAARAAVKSIAAIDAGQLEPRSLQSYRKQPAPG
jgi:carbamoyl-phosphate synthase large subunit